MFYNLATFKIEANSYLIVFIFVLVDLLEDWRFFLCFLANLLPLIYPCY